jgi:hypothetical protein
MSKSASLPSGEKLALCCFAPGLRSCDGREGARSSVPEIKPDSAYISPAPFIILPIKVGGFLDPMMKEKLQMKAVIRNLTLLDLPSITMGTMKPKASMLLET